MNLTELIHGNWYEGQSYERWIFKFNRIENATCFWSTLACSPIDGYKVKYSSKFINLVNLKPANMEEVYKFFPEEKQKKTIYELW